MNKEKKQQAKDLYFQTDLSKAQIAEKLGISRRSLHYWIKNNNWERLKLSATYLPSMLAENGYLLIAQQQKYLLSELRMNQPLTHKAVDILYKLTLSVRKLKNHSTLNEGMEIFANLLDRVNNKSPELAEQLAPFIDEYIENWANISLSQFKPDNLNDMGYFTAPPENPTSPAEGGSAAFTEEQLDKADIHAWEYEEELKKQLKYMQQKEAATEEDKLQNEMIIQQIETLICSLQKDRGAIVDNAELTVTKQNCHPEFTEGAAEPAVTVSNAEPAYFEKNGHNTRLEYFRSFEIDTEEKKRRKQLMDEVLQNCAPAQKVRNFSALNH